MYKLPDDLYEYQKEDVARMTQPGNWLNFSEMGTGKTPESLGVCELLNFRRVLILCPNSLRWEWARQIKEWTGKDPAVSLRPARKRLDPFFEFPSRYYIINYESLRVSRYREIIVGLPWNCIILDEGHKIRNPRALQTKGVFELTQTALKRDTPAKIMVLTGSPIVNNPVDLFTLLTIVKPEKYIPTQRSIFIDRYCYYVPTRYGGIHVYGTKNLDELREKTESFTVRRTKKEVLPYLPDKYYRFPGLTMDDKQRKVYNQMEDELFVLLDSGEPLYAPSVLAQLTRLRQINLEPKILPVEAPSTKTEFLDDLIESFIDDNKYKDSPKLVVFSCFAKYIYYLSLRYSKIGHVRLTGEEHAEARAKSIERFQNDPDIKLALGTIQSMGEGITLTAASNVVLMDRWWSPAVNTQAIDRLHRIGQKNAVQVIIPVCIDTIDQSLSSILKRKEQFAAGYFSDQSVISETITERRTPSA